MQCMISHRAKNMTLVEVSEIAAGHPLRSGVDEFPPGDTGVIQMRNVDPETGVDWASVSRVELPPARRIELLKPGDVIFSTRGTRTYAVALGAAPFPAVCSPHFFVLRIRGGTIEPRFLAWQINQAPAQEYLQREATGSHILNIRREVIERLEIVIPSLARQAAIVAFADDVTREKRLLSALIENRQHQMNALAAGLRVSSEE
jgi:type I restriction modification DNA specificity protein